MEELDTTWDRLLKVWWLFTWRGVVMAAVAGFLAGVVAGVIVGLIGHPEWGKIAGGIAGLCIWFPVAVVAMRMAFRKQYSDFRIAMLPVKHDEHI